MRSMALAALTFMLVALKGPAAEPKSEPIALATPKLQLVDRKVSSDLFVWSDICNVYVLRQNGAALLIDLGDGSVLEHLAEIGVTNVEWVLLTHHHREQCLGAPRLKTAGTKFAAPAAERSLFEQPASFRKMNVRLGDAFTVHGASYVRPPLEPIHLDRTFSSMDTFAWRGLEITCLDTRGNSPGGMSYLIRQKNGQWLAFSGDVMLKDARMHTWFDSEWDYGFAAGIYALVNSASLLECYHPRYLLPSHGPVIPGPDKELASYQIKLRRLEKLLLRGYDVNTFASADQDRASKPTVVPFVWQITPHIFKFKGPNFFPNLNLILADNGHALAVDCGLFDEGFLDRSLELMRERLGLKQIDAVIISHMHGDHILEAPHLREKWGAQIWALDRMADKFEHPERYDYSAPIQAYGKGFDSVKIDRVFHSGEKLDWQGYHLQVDWMPGQTEFAMCLQGEIDGRKVAFTGDNIFADPRNPKQDGHEAVVAHNSAILDEGYILGAEYLHRLKPDLILGGHSYVMNRPADLIERYRHWAYQMRDTFRALSSRADYRYWFDPFWVRAEPYRLKLKPGESTEFALHLRNFDSHEQKQTIQVLTPPGLKVNTPRLEASIGPSGRKEISIKISADGNASKGVSIIAFDVTAGGERFGPLFDVIVEVVE